MSHLTGSKLAAMTCSPVRLQQTDTARGAEELRQNPSTVATEQLPKKPQLGVGDDLKKLLTKVL